MQCPKCCSATVSVQAVAEAKKRGFFMSLFWFILGLCTIGLIWIIPLITKKGSKTRSYALCQNCGYRWKINKSSIKKESEVIKASV